MAQMILKCNRNFFKKNLDIISKIIYLITINQIINTIMKYNIKKSRLWISGVGVALACGFFNNCALVPFLEGSEPVNWIYLILALSVMLGIGGARDVVLRQFRYLGPVLEESKKSSEKGFWALKVWIPIVGWCLALGFAVNCCLCPFLKIGEVSWEGLLAALSVLLSVSGVREYKIYNADREVLSEKGDIAPDETPTEFSD